MRIYDLSIGNVIVNQDEYNAILKDKRERADKECITSYLYDHIVSIVPNLKRIFSQFEYEGCSAYKSVNIRKNDLKNKSFESTLEFMSGDQVEENVNISLLLQTNETIRNELFSALRQVPDNSNPILNGLIESFFPDFISADDTPDWQPLHTDLSYYTAFGRTLESYAPGNVYFIDVSKDAINILKDRHIPYIKSALVQGDDIYDFCASFQLGISQLNSVIAKGNLDPNIEINVQMYSTFSSYLVDITPAKTQTEIANMKFEYFMRTCNRGYFEKYLDVFIRSLYNWIYLPAHIYNSSLTDADFMNYFFTVLYDELFETHYTRKEFYEEFKYRGEELIKSAYEILMKDYNYFSRNKDSDEYESFLYKMYAIFSTLLDLEAINVAGDLFYVVTSTCEDYTPKYLATDFSYYSNNKGYTTRYNDGVTNHSMIDYLDKEHSIESTKPGVRNLQPSIKIVHNDTDYKGSGIIFLKSTSYNWCVSGSAIESITNCATTRLFEGIYQIINKVSDSDRDLIEEVNVYFTYATTSTAAFMNGKELSNVYR